MKTFFLLTAVAVCCCGMSQGNLDGIETAIIQQDFAQARQLSEEFIAAQPDLSSAETQQAHYYLGLSQLNLEQYRNARETFGKIVAARPERKIYEKASLGIVDSYYMSGEYANALKFASPLLKDNERPEFLSLIYLKIARANLKLANWGEARKYLNKIIEQFPNTMEAHLAKQLLEEKKFFSVQVGSFLDRERSGNLAQTLKAKGEYAYVLETVDFTGRNFYRVRIGQFSNLEEAHQLKNKLAQQGYPTRIYP